MRDQCKLWDRDIQPIGKEPSVHTGNIEIVVPVRACRENAIHAQLLYGIAVAVASQMISVQDIQAAVLSAPQNQVLCNRIAVRRQVGQYCGTS